MSHEGEIKELQSQVSGLQERLSWLEREREALHSSQKTASEQQASKVKTLEKVCVCNTVYECGGGGGGEWEGFCQERVVNKQWVQLRKHGWKCHSQAFHHPWRIA